MKTAEDAIKEYPTLAKKLSGIDKTPDKRYLFRICQMFDNKEANIKELKSIFIERAAISNYLLQDIVEGKDVFTLLLENKKGSFRKRWYFTKEQFDVWKKTVIYEDEYTTVNKPSSFEESRNVGNPQWCFCYKNDKWIQHNEMEHETIYFVHSVKVPRQWEYNAICVLPNGDKKVLDGQHSYLSRKNGDLTNYLSDIKEASKILISDKNITESKTHKNMKKETIKMNETQLRNMIAESVKKVLKESSQEDLYHIIANLEADIKTVISNTDSSSSQAFGSPDEKFKMIVNSLTHIDSNLSMKAESTFNKLLGVISELQDLRISLKTLGAKDSYWGA